MSGKKVNIVDQTIRDAQQSLWGNRMPTDMITPIAPVMDEVGYSAIAVTGARAGVIGSRDLKENMFDRFRMLSQLITKTPLRGSYMPWAAFGFDVEPLAVIELYIRRIVASGLKQLWTCDYQNMVDRSSYLVNVAHDAGAEVIMAVLYTPSPVHTDELYAKKTKVAVEMGVDAIHLEDASGILTPERAKTLVPTIVNAANGVRVEFHAHCCIGLGPQCYAEGITMGLVNTVHTAVMPLANESSLPSTEGTIRNIRALGYTVDLNEEALKKESDHFTKEATARGMRIGVPVEFNVENFQHQLPGGMLGTMRNQLVDIKQEHRFPEVMEELGRVREEFGYPVMATPYSQICGAQALFNVTSGGRYKVVVDEAIMYMAGIIGDIDGPVDQNVKDKILSMPKAKKFLNWKPADITLDDLRRLEPGLSDDDLLMRISDPDKELKDRLKVLYGRA